VFPGARLGRHVSRLYVAPQLARQHLLARMQPSYAVYHLVGATRSALASCVARSSAIGFAIVSKIHFKSWKRLHHQRSSRHAMVPLSDPLNSAFLKTEVLHRLYALCSPAHLTVASARTWRGCSELHGP
jgi:hypothetical protein